MFKVLYRVLMLASLIGAAIYGGSELEVRAVTLMLLALFCQKEAADESR